MNKFIVTFIICAVYCAQVEALKCVQCSGCTQPWTNATDPSTNCLVGDTCIKTSITYPGGGSVMKGCVTSGSCKPSEMLIATYGYSLTCCTGDDCNSASFVEFKLAYLMLSVLAAFLYKLL